MAIMEITMGNREECERRHVLSGHASAALRKPHGDDSQGNFHFIIPPSPCPFPSNRTFHHFPPMSTAPLSPNWVHHFGNNVRGFLTVILNTRVERSSLSSRYERIQSMLQRSRHPRFVLLFAPSHEIPRASMYVCTYRVASFIRCRVYPH